MALWHVTPSMAGVSVGSMLRVSSVIGARFPSGAFTWDCPRAASPVTAATELPQWGATKWVAASLHALWHFYPLFLVAVCYSVHCTAVVFVSACVNVRDSISCSYCIYGALPFSLVHPVLQPIQLTGRCDCLPNVGSETDDKCCNCTPGFFGFSQVEGCQGEHWLMVLLLCKHVQYVLHTAVCCNQVRHSAIQLPTAVVS